MTQHRSTHRARVRAALEGRVLERPPVALWRHFPAADSTAEGLARAVLEFQREFDFDLVKVTPASGYMAEAWGAQLVPKNNPEGTREYLTRPIHTPQAWSTLGKLNPREGVLGRELKALTLTRRELQRDTPIVQTIFSALTTAKNLRGDHWLDDLREHPEELHAGLDIISETTLAFARESLRAGADGLFFATQLASSDVLSLEEYKKFGAEYDLRILTKLAPECELLVLHIHGMNIFFELLAEYPVQVINWHDRRTPPPLGAGQRRSGKTVLGGLNEWETLLLGTPEAVRAQARDACEQTSRKNLILGAGCVIPITVPKANVHAAAHSFE